MASQAEREFALQTPLGEDVLLLRTMTGREELGRLFEYRLEVLSDDAAINLDDLLGQNVTVRVNLADGEKRFFNGVVSAFTQVPGTLVYSVYHVTVHPWLWLLTRRSDCRIFQQKTVPDIIKEVFREAGFSDFEERLSGAYREWEYCVQYRETDFNFVSRLMEQEGIYYYFLHEEGKHTMVLADATSAHETYPGYEEVPYFPPDQHDHRERDHLNSWQFTHSVQPAVYTMRDFNFKTPTADMESGLGISRDHTASEFEIYDYPGEYTKAGEGDVYARVRAEELQARFQRAQGSGNARGMAAGSLFKLIGHPRRDQNREYLIVAATLSLSSDEFESGSTGSGNTFSCGIDLLDAAEQFRAQRATPKPMVQGPQTAIVVGPSGEEIYTDEFGRVKVQFHWDRLGDNDENSSCWIRVSHNWAGKNWGAVALPRMGHEVIVDFLEGDPDQPIITGRVYNADNTHPYGLPDNKTQTGIKSRSSKGGSGDNFNEIRFEDKKGSEEMYLHAEKNQNTMVENNQGITVGNDKTESIGHDNTEDIGNDEKITVGNNRDKTVGVDQTETIGSNKTIQVGVNHSETIGSNMSITIGANLTENVAVNYAETVGVAMELTVGAAMAETVGANKTQTIGANKSETIGAKKSVSVGADESVKIGANKSEDVGASRTRSVGKDEKVDVGKKLAITAGDEISLTTGKAKLIMKKDGTIMIEGKDLTIKGSGKINMKASKDIVIKGKKILQN